MKKNTVDILKSLLLLPALGLMIACGSGVSEDENADEKAAGEDQVEEGGGEDGKADAEKLGFENPEFKEPGGE